MIKKFEGQGERYKILVMAVLLAVCCFLTYYFHTVLKSGRVFTNFYYIPIILASIWWKRKGLAVAVFLAVWLILRHFFIRADVEIINDLLRASMFIAVSLVAALLSEKIDRGHKEIEKEKNYSESIIQNFLDTLIVVDADANIQTMNPATCQLLGYTEKELIGQPVSKIFKEEVYRLFQFFRYPGKKEAPHLQDTIRNRELTYKTKDGRLIPMSFNASVLSDEAGNITGVVARAKDITEIKRAEAQRAAALEERRKTEEHFRKVIENIFKFVPEGLLVFTDKINLFKQNKAFQDIVKKYSSKLNYTERELAEIIIEQVKNRIINEDYADIRIPENKDRETKNKQNNL